jgi:hypothetical protein
MFKNTNSEEKRECEADAEYIEDEKILVKYALFIFLKSAISRKN